MKTTSVLSKLIKNSADKKLSQLNLNSFLEVNNPFAFCLKVEDDSLKGFGINKNDIIVCRHDLRPHQGDLVVIFVDGKMVIHKKQDDIAPEMIDFRVKVTNPRSSDPKGYFIGVVCSLFRSLP